VAATAIAASTAPARKPFIASAFRGEFDEAMLFLLLGERIRFRFEDHG
jgi:hypothetical protein